MAASLPPWRRSAVPPLRALVSWRPPAQPLPVASTWPHISPSPRLSAVQYPAARRFWPGEARGATIRCSEHAAIHPANFTPQPHTTVPEDCQTPACHTPITPGRPHPSLLHAPDRSHHAARHTPLEPHLVHGYDDEHNLLPPVPPALIKVLEDDATLRRVRRPLILRHCRPPAGDSEQAGACEPACSRGRRRPKPGNAHSTQACRALQQARWACMLLCE